MHLHRILKYFNMFLCIYVYISVATLSYLCNLGVILLFVPPNFLTVNLLKLMCFAKLLQFTTVVCQNKHLHPSLLNLKHVMVHGHDQTKLIKFCIRFCNTSKLNFQTA